MISKPGEYEFFEHTADAKFRAYGKTLEESFRNAARACFAIVTDVDLVKPIQEFPIEVNAKRLEAALFDFLDELLFLLDTEGFLLHDCRQMKIEKKTDGSYHICCVVVGDYHKSYDVSCNVKAVTYNDMKIEKSPDGYMMQVVVDL